MDVITIIMSNPFSNGEKRWSFAMPHIIKSRLAWKKEVRMNTWSDIHHIKRSTKNKTEILSILDIVLFLSGKKVYPSLNASESISTSLPNNLERFSNRRKSAETKEPKKPVGHEWMTGLFLLLPTTKWETTLLFWEQELQRSLIKQVVWNLAFNKLRSVFSKCEGMAWWKYLEASLFITLGLSVKNLMLVLTWISVISLRSGKSKQNKQATPFSCIM